MSSAQIETGLAHLRSVDPVLGEVISRVGPFSVRLERDRFRALVRSIISQQISGLAAQSIFKRLIKAVGPGGLIPERLVACSPEELRAAGLSAQKAAYLRDLSEKVQNGQVRLTRLSGMADELIIEQLTEVKGIGVWTAQMFLIFSLGRLDVFPYADLGVRMALRNLYRLKDLPDRKRAEHIAAAWKPFSTLASWYCWRSLELPAASGR